MGAPSLEGTHTATIASDVIVSYERRAGTLSPRSWSRDVVGDLAGTSAWTKHGVLHADGSAEYLGTGTFTGTLAGTGAVTYDFQTQFRATASGEVPATRVASESLPFTDFDGYAGWVLSPIYTDQ